MKDLTPGTLNALQAMIQERIINVDMIKKTKVGITEVQCLISEVCVIESKLNALIKMCEDDEKDWSKFSQYVEASANQARQVAIETRKIMAEGLKRSRIIKPE